MSAATHFPTQIVITLRGMRKYSTVRARAKEFGGMMQTSPLKSTKERGSKRLGSTRYDARRGVIVSTGSKLARGRHRLRLVASDYQELKNMENVRRILPNTAQLRTAFLVH